MLPCNLYTPTSLIAALTFFFLGTFWYPTFSTSRIGYRVSVAFFSHILLHRLLLRGA